MDFDTKYQEEEFFLHVYDKHHALQTWKKLVVTCSADFNASLRREAA